VWERSEVTDRDSLHALLAHHAIEQLHTTYADVVNRRAWDELGPLFTAHATIQVDTVSSDPVEATGAGELADFLDRAVARFAFLEFVVLTLRVEAPAPEAPDRTTSRLWMREVRRDLGTLAWSEAYGLYRDSYRRDGDTWRFASRRYRSITRTDGDVFALPDPLDP